MGELVQFIPRSRRSRDSDFPVIVFKGPGATMTLAEHWKQQLEANALIPSIFDTAPSEYCAPETDPA